MTRDDAISEPPWVLEAPRIAPLAAVRRDRWVVVAFLLIGSILLFTRLGDRLLWQDEAETALLARSVLVHGVPTAYDGRNIISQERQTEFDAETYLWLWTPWLPHYLTAASFAVLGEGTGAARIPFALLGLGCVLLTYLLTLRITGDRRAARVAALVLLSSVFFLLYMRQCRYYAPASFFSLLLVLQYLRVLEDRPRAHWWMALAAMGLFHSFYVLCAAVLIATALHFAIFERDLDRLKRLFRSWSAILLTCGPFAVLFAAHTADRALPGIAEASRNAVIAVDHINSYAVPFILILALPLFRSRNSQSSTAAASSNLWLVPIVLLSCIALLAAVMPLFFFRYYAVLIPFGAILQGIVVARLWTWNGPAAMALLLVLVVTDLAPRAYPFLRTSKYDRLLNVKTGDERPDQVVGAWARFIPMAAYAYELSHPISGPIAALVDYLNEHADSKDTVLITYGDLPLQFYTPLKVVGGRSGIDVRDHLDVEWIVLRSAPPTNRKNSAILAREIDWERYREIFLDAIDIPFEQRPDPGYHKFRTVTEGLPRLVVYRRVEQSDASGRIEPDPRADAAVGGGGLP